MVQPSSKRTSQDTAAPVSYRPIKITAVGDGMVGKTCLLISYVHKHFPEEYVPTIFDNHAENIEVDGQNFNMALWDTAGQEDYERLRPLSYPNTQCFLVCFSVVNRTSFANIALKWTPEIRHYCPDVPIVLVGTKMDLRQESNFEHLTEKEGRKLARKIRAFDYVECSAKDMCNLDNIFVTAIKAVLRKTHTKKVHSCAIL